MSRKRIEKRVNRLFTDIKDASDESEKPLPSPEISEQHYAQPSEELVGEGKPGVSDTDRTEPEAQRPEGIFGRIRNWITRRRSGIEEVQEIVPDELKVDQRLVGEQPPEVSPDQVISKPKKMARQKQAEQPEKQPEQVEVEPEKSRLPTATRDAVEPKLDEIRPATLEGYEPPPPKKLSVWGRFKAWFRDLRPELKVLLFSSIFVFAAISFFFILILFRPAQPEVVQPVVPNLDPSIPIPAMITLPDGQVFELSLGSVVDGVWSPQAPEWLVDTEVPRWLSLPWSEDLEAAARLFARNDPIQLSMSNGDILVYRFLSLEEISPADLSEFNANTANLLVMLYKSRNPTYLVLVATP